MATRTIAFRLNDKNREDKEIMEWLDQVVYESEYYDSLTEAVKWAILCFVRGEIRFREEMSTMELMQEFVRDFAKQSKADNEQIMQDAIQRFISKLDSIGVVYRYSDDMSDEFIRLEAVAEKLQQEQKMEEEISMGGVLFKEGKKSG